MKRLIVLALSLAMTGCVATYRDFPEAALDKPPAPGTCSVMQYNVKRFDILDMGGYRKLQTVFRDGRICRKMVSVEGDPGRGLYVEVETKWKPMSFPALIFGYVSVSTLTLLPAWSNHDGYVVKYHVHLDGQKAETYQYEITRKVGIWLGLLPLAWINLITYDEEDAFEATAYQFMSDARQFLDRPGL